MPGQEPILKDQDRAKLDGIVKEMTANKESDKYIQSVVDDFKSKYATVPETVKKKEETSNLEVSPSGSLEKKTKTEPQSTPSASATQPDSGDFFDAVFNTDRSSKKPDTKNKKQEFVNTPGAADVSDEKGSLLSDTEEKLTKDQKDEAKAKVHERVVNFRNNFFNGSLTADDIGLIPGDLSGVSNSQAAEAINNKTKNLKVWGNVTAMRGLQNYDKQFQIVSRDLDLAKKQWGDHTDKIRDLENKQAFLSHSITQVYNAEADKTTGELVSNLKNSLNGGPIKYDQYTNTIDEKSQFYIRKTVDDYLNTHQNDVINYKTSGTTKDGKRNYPDIANRVISYFNTVIPVQKAHEQVTKDIVTKYPQAKGLINHLDQLNGHFSKDQVDKVTSYVNTFQDKAFLGVQDKYFGATGTMSSNPEFISLQRKYKDAVDKKEISEDVAKSQMEQEIKHNKSLNKIYDNYSKSVEGVQSQGKKMWEDYIIEGLKKIDPSLTMYKNGNVGIEGMNQEDSKKILDEYNSEITKSTARTLHEQSEKLNHRADEKARHVGAFWSSFGGAINDMQGAFTKYFFDKTGWGGGALEMFQAKQGANIPITESEEAKKWNWTGLRSLKDPNFYQSALGSQLPLFGGAAAVTAATRGAGLPEYVAWMSTAGLFDASMSLSTYNNIASNGRDKYGNKLTEHDASVAAADQFNSSILPDMFFAAANLGILSKAKNISKPTLLKSLGTAGKGIAIGTLPMVWQGYAQYAAQLSAEGKTPGLWDYAQDGKLAHSMIEGLVGGAFLQLAHTPMDHIKKTENWKRMIYTSTGEFYNNSMFSIGLSHEMAGLGNQWRDAMKLKIGTEEMTHEEKEDVKNTLLYSTSLEKNIKGGGIDISNVNGAYQAHTLALADLHDQWAKSNEDNPNLAKIYSEQAGDYRKQAKAVMEGKGKFHYLTDVTDQPIFISDQSFKVLDADGRIADWIKSGTIEGVHSSTEPSFDKEYKDKMKAATKTPDVESVPVKEPVVEAEDQTGVIDALKTHQGDIQGTFKLIVDNNIGDPKQYEAITKEIISQAIDHPVLAKEMLGNEIWKKIEPIVIEQKKLAETAEKERVAAENKKTSDDKVLKQEVDDIDIKRKAREKIDFEGKKVRADVAIDKLKERHQRLEDVLNCL